MMDIERDRDDRDQDSEAERRALDAYGRLVRAAGSAAARLQRGALAAEGLTESQFGVLEALFTRGPLTQTELGRQILKSSGNLTLVVDNLERRRLVRRERNPEDRRSVSVHLTAEGRHVIQAVLPRHVRSVLDEMSALSPAEQEELGRLCGKLEPNGCGQGGKESASPYPGT
jgi:MarR family 2-MHQ and catechol resistance regulon transcriptional repressor